MMIFILMHLMLLRYEILLQPRESLVMEMFSSVKGSQDNHWIFALSKESE